MTVNKLFKSFKQGGSRVEAVRGIDFTASQGEFVAIMGPSGSGKSTFLHLVAGLTNPDSGSITIEGMDIASLSDAKQTQFRRTRIGLVFQAYNLIPTLSAEQNITLPLALGGGECAKGEELDELLERLSLTQRRAHRPDALSGGEQQRVAIARALITDPAVILADEPTGNLDTETTQHICKELKSICHDKKKTLLLVTHEPSVAFHADCICVLKDGHLTRRTPVSDFNSVEELARHYQTVVVGKADEVISA